MSQAPLYEDLARAPAGGQAHWIHAADGLRLRIAHWPAGGETRHETGREADAGGQDAPPGAPAKGTIFLLPGRTEYIEKYGLSIAAFSRGGYAVASIDWRGQGLSARLHRDPLLGHIRSFRDFQLDLDSLLAAAGELGLPEPWMALSHSMGGAITLRRLLGRHPFRAAVFSAPMWGINLPRWLGPLSPGLSRRLSGRRFAEHYVPATGHEPYVLRAPFHGNLLTTDARMWAYMIDQLGARPELGLGGTSYNWVAESLLECEALAALPSPDLPCLTALGSHERVIDPVSVRARMARWPKGRLLEVPGGEHEVMMERPEHRQSFHDAALELFDSVAVPVSG